MVGSAGFMSLLQEFLDFYCREHPEFATHIGIHTYDDQLSDPSPEGAKRWVECLKCFRELFREISASTLCKDERLDLQIVRSAFDKELYSIEEIALWRKNPDHVMRLCHALDPLYSRDFPGLDQRMCSLCSRLEKASLFLELSKSAIIEPVKVYTEIVLEGIPLARSFLRTVEESVAPLLASDLQKSMRNAAVKAFESLAAYERYLRDDVLPRSEPRFAFGKERFDKMLELMGLEMDVSELIQLGEASLARSKTLIGGAASKLGLSGDWMQALQEVRQDKPRNWSEAFSLYKETVHRLRTLTLEKGVATMPPRDNLEVLETPAYWRHISQLMASYQEPPPFQKDQTGRFYITPISDSKMLTCRAETYLICLHETYPGHHLHLSCSKENPSLARRLFVNLPLIEGWAHYVEEYCLTQFNLDPELELIFTRGAMTRASRAILSPKLHTEQLTANEAVEFLVKEVGLERRRAESEVRMYVLNPFQSLSHFAGKHLILKLKEEVKQRMGSRFTDRFFHDTLLYSGKGVSFKILRDIFLEAMSG